MQDYEKTRSIAMYAKPFEKRYVTTHLCPHHTDVSPAYRFTTSGRCVHCKIDSHAAGKKPGPKGPRKVMTADGYGGGNYTRGGSRKGYTGGRKPLYDPLTPVWRPPVILDDQHYAMALYLGCGSISKGVNLALTHAAKNLHYLPGTRAAAKAMVKTHRVSIRRDVAHALGLEEPTIPTSGGHRLKGAAVLNEQRMDFDAEVTQADLENLENLENLNLENLEEWER